MKRGNDFDRNRSKHYPFNEVALKTGKRLDSYDPDSGQIVSRKATDFDTIEESTFQAYLDEFEAKYSRGTETNSTKYAEEDLPKGTTLQGDYILEVPDSNLSAANRQKFETMADEMGIQIRYSPE